jgi:probable biosynthetic protein (TIGR04098 family)
MESWASHQFTVEMPHMSPGEKLSEVEFLKLLAAYQWQAIADMLETPPQDITNDQNERLYGSVIDFEMNFGPHSGPDVLCEGQPVFVRNRINFFAKRFVEGFFVFGNREVPESALGALKTKADIHSLGLPCAYMTNAFIARAGGNTKLKVYMPAGLDGKQVVEITETPGGIVDHRRVQGTGEIPGFGDDCRPLPTLGSDPIRYAIVPESDLNGAGLVYFARYLAMMNYGERVLLSERLDPPLSHPLVACLSTEHRRVFFFANAGASDSVEIRVVAGVLLPGQLPEDREARRWRTPMKFVFRHDLVRASDKVLMASSLVRKSLNVPGDQKGVLMEAERMLSRLA